MDDRSNAAAMAIYAGAQFPILSDPNAQVINQYGVYNLLRDGVAAPATFILGKNGTVVWAHVAENIRDRPPADEILQQLAARLE